MIDLVGRGVAVVGAGISGLRCAQGLQDAGCLAQVLDKSGDIGGRLATRVRPEGVWNHGAQQLAFADPQFARFVADLIAAEGATLTGDPENPDAVTGAPNMRELLRPLADALECRFDCVVSDVTRVPGGWRLLDQQGGLHGDYAALVLALPAPLAGRLLSGISEPFLARKVARLVEPLTAVSYSSCWSLLVRCSRTRAVPRVVNNEMISEIFPQPDSRCWVVHATSDWSARQIDQTESAVAASLLMELKALCSADPDFQVEHVEAHRWRYSVVSEASNQPALWDSDIGLGLCGDWCLPEAAQKTASTTHAAEAAFLSGSALAAMMCS